MRALGLVIAAAVACSPERAMMQPDGNSPIPCANGVVEAALGEQCDDGPDNGNTLCTKQCRDGRTEVPASSFIELGFENDRAVAPIIPGEFEPGLAYTSSDMGGIHIIPALHPDFFGSASIPSTAFTLPVKAPPIALAEISISDWSSIDPIWIESDGNELHMYVADLRSPVAVTEVPFAFESTSPSVLSARESPGFFVVEQNVSSHELVVTKLLMRSPTDFDVKQLRVAGPGQERGAAIQETYWDPIDEVSIQRLVVFFDDTHAFVTLEDRLRGGDYWNSAAYTLSESARGGFPFSVVAGERWHEHCLDDARPEEQHPSPLIVLTEGGDFFISAFVSGEQLATPYGHVMPGTTAMGVMGREPLIGIWAYEADGNYAYLADGDCLDPQSHSLAVQRFPGPGADASAVFVLGLGGAGFPGTVIGKRYYYNN